jgi:DNA-binding transcriptional MerR regulator
LLKKGLKPEAEFYMLNDEKLFYSIGEVAQVLEVKPYVLRYWESEFKKLNPQKSASGQRTYRKKDIQVALAIKKLLYDEKYTIAGAQVKLEEMEQEGFDRIVLPPLNGSLAKSEIERVPDTTDAQKHEERYSDEPEVIDAISDEKIAELKNLITSTNGILKKYHLA